MHRRQFLTDSAKASVGWALFAVTGCTSRKQMLNKAKPTAPRRVLVADLQIEISKLMTQTDVPGVSIAMIEDAAIVWERGFGVKDAQSRQPVTTNTVFEAASMSKPVFAYAALKLCEHGIIGLDTPLSQYAPKPFVSGDPQSELITARHILSHSSGLPNWRSGNEPLATKFAPGTQYNYSGEGYYYLQSVITHLTGRIDPSDCATFEADFEVCATDFEVFMRTNILQPFRMESSGYSCSRTIQREMASPHGNDGNRLPERPASAPAVARYGAAGALLTTPRDYAAFMIEVLAPTGPDLFRLKPQTIHEMLRPHVKVIHGPHTSSWALGWQVQDDGLINHGGDNRGFHCHAVASPKTKCGLVVMTNGDGGPELIQNLFATPAIKSLLA